MSKLSLLEIAQSQLDKTPVIDGQLIVCLDTGNAYRDTATAHVKIGSDLEVVSDLPLAPLAEKIYYLKPDKLYAYLGGNWTLLNDKTIDLDKVIAKLPAGSSTALNDDVEIITQDTDTTQAHYYRRKLVVIWEYIKTKAQDFFAAKNHKHKKADITDFPTSMPASDVYPWAKAAKKPSYTKAEIGLGKVDNTADADKTVKRATTAGTADSANSVAWENVKDKPTTFPVEAHNHDDRYYTEAEVNSKLNNKVDNTEAGANGLINKLESGTAAPVDNDLIITQWANHTTATAANQNRYVRRPMSSIWSYIKSKADSVYQPKGSYAASGHTHDDRYYTESEMNTKLSGKSNIDHTHNIIKDSGDGRNIKIAYSKSGLNYGDYSWLAGWNGEELRAVNKNQFATANHTHPTSEIYGGNVNYSGYAGPIESAHIDVLRANRLAFLPASGIKVEYSVDGGATWIDYGATDDQKASLFAMRMGSAALFYTGKHTKADECTIKDQLRITVTPVDRYASVNMLYLWVSVAGTSATVNISRSTIGAKETFTDVRTDVPISGWSGPNEIRFSGGTFGGGSTQTSNAYAYRFTFKNKADGKGSVSVMDIRMYGPSAWGVPNNMMEKDHIYNWDANQNVHFPAQVTATKFNGSSTGIVDYGNAAGATIKVGFNGAGLTKDNLTHIAGYAKDGNQTVIKDVSKGVLQSWLDLGASAYKKVQSLSAVGHSDWQNQSTDDGYVPTMAFMAFWNGAFSGSGSSNLQYCDRGRFGTIVTKNSGDYATAGHTHSFASITGKPSTYTPSAHTHDDRYYTETEINAKLDGKSNTGHTHDDRYYTEAEINTKLNGKAPNEHTHQYLSLYEARPANINFTKSTNGTGAMFHFVATSSTTTGKPPADSSILQLNWDNSGGWDSQLALSTTANPHVYYRNQQNGTWGNWNTLLDNLNYTDYVAKKEHTHTKSQITDFPASLKNPTALTIQTNGTTAVIYDGSAAKTVNITKGNIGLGNVDNTADANKSVKYATSAGNASKVNNHTVNIDVPANAKFTDTTYGVATASSNGLMSSTDKTKLDDFSRVISIQKQIKLTTDWQDTGIAGNNLETGTYVVQVSGFNASYTSLYSETYSGIMTWYASETNSDNYSEIFLHNAGHADNSNAIYLRTSRRAYGNGGLHLQIACKVAASGTDTLTFKFRRLI